MNTYRVKLESRRGSHIVDVHAADSWTATSKALDENRRCFSSQVVSENKFCEHGNRIGDFCMGCEQQRMG